MSGEIIPIIEAVDFSTKTELLTKLRSMRDSTHKLAKEDRRVVKDMLGVAIQEVYFTPAKEVMRFKHYLSYKQRGGKKYESE